MLFIFLSVDPRQKAIIDVLTGACPSGSPLPRLRWRYRRHEGALPAFLIIQLALVF